MLNQAELKMNIRNEHLRDTQRHSNLRKQFATEVARERHENQQSQVAVPVPTISITHSSDLILATSHSGSGTSNNNSMATSNDETTDPNTAGNTFRRLVEQHMNQADIDRTDNKPLFPLGPLSRDNVTRYQPMRIQDIFDFSNPYWKELIKKTVTRTFDQELEFYNMLDLDADGEDLGADVDDLTGEVLTG